MGHWDSKPWAIMCSPPMPWKRASGRCGRRPDSSRAASMSPDGSPATSATDRSADDATAGNAEEVAHGADMQRHVGRAGVFLGLQRGLGFFQRQAGTVDQLVGGADAVDLLARETAALQAFDV